MAGLRDTAGFPETVARLRRRRASFEEIAAHLGISAAQAAELYRQALASLPELKAAELRAEELVLADDAIRRLMTIAASEEATARTAVEAWNSIRGWAEHKARLLGIDQPERQPESRNGGLHAIRQARRA